MFVKSPKFKVQCECGWKTTSGVTNYTAFQKMNVHQQQDHGLDIYGRPM